MNYPVILKILSMLFAIMALAFSLCAGVSVFYYSESPLEGEALPAWISIVALSILLAFAFFLPSRTASGKLFKKEAMCIVGTGWVLASLLGTVPYVMILDVSFADAFFESSSGLTTTGASVFGDFSDFPRSLMFWRCLSHWIGGLGVVMFFVAILSFLGSDGRILYSRETSADSGGGVETERIQSIALKIIGLYLSISAICAISYKLCSMTWYDAICHMFSTVSTGGFSVYENSISHYDSLAVYWVVALFMFIGGVGFSTIIFLASGKFHRAMQNTELKVYVGILLLSGFSMAIFVYADPDNSKTLWETITHSIFNSVSIMTTTGFMSEDYQKWPPITHSVFLALMIIGGCSGSTSGGIKVSRLILAYALCKNHLEKSFRPRVVRPVKINGKIVGEKEAADALSYIVMYSLIALASIQILSFLEPNLKLSESISAVLTLIGNAGPGFDRVGPAENYGFMNGASKIFLGVLMIMGRLEFYAILALFMPSLWKKFQ